MSTMTNLLPERIIIVIIRLFMFVHKVILNISAQMCRAAWWSHSVPLSNGFKIIEVYEIPRPKNLSLPGEV